MRMQTRHRRDQEILKDIKRYQKLDEEKAPPKQNKLAVQLQKVHLCHIGHSCV